MYRSYILSTTSPSEPCMLPRLLIPLALWICVSLSLRYGYYGTHHLLLGPNSSQLLEASSVFVQQIQVRSNADSCFSLYGYLEKPELSLETNWTSSNYLYVQPYSNQGFTLWLNKGSKIHVKWEIRQGNWDNILVVLIKGDHNSKTLMRQPASSPLVGFMNFHGGNREVEYRVEAEDSYYVGAVNLNSRSIVMSMNVDLSSKMYDTSKAKTVCSTTKGFCRLKLVFPNHQYVVLATPSDVDSGAWDIELSFMARLATYIIILGIVVVIICVVFKCLGSYENERAGTEAEAEATEPSHETETDPLLPAKDAACLYGTIDEDLEDGLNGSSNDLYDGKLCVICYDEERNCYFVPCGHCAVCYVCAQRIVNGENKVCPICRRLIHRVRRLPKS